jgi:hypothetical protein
MGKFHGMVGYANMVEKAPGVFVDSISRRPYYGDVLEMSMKWSNGISINDNIGVTSRISIVADAYAFEHFSKMKYCEWMGVKWKVVDIKPLRPRIILTLGGEYNADKTGPACGV